MTMVMIKNLLKFFKKIFHVEDNGFNHLYKGNLSKKNILILTEYINATYFISFDIPLKALHSEGKLNFAVLSQDRVQLIKESTIKKLIREFKPDYAIFSRYGHHSGRFLYDLLRDMQVPIVYHIDDNLLEIPPSLGAEIQKRQGNLEVIETREFLLQHCDLIYPSTEYLAELFKRKFPTKSFFYGIYAPYLGAQLEMVAADFKQEIVIGYMGSKGHKEDLELVVPAIERILKERPEVRFELFGSISMPTQLEKFSTQIQRHSVNKSYIEFLEKLSTLGWTVGLAPLVDEPFNRCKAPTKYIEYTAASIPVIASDINVYNQVIDSKRGILVKNDWYEAIVKALDESEMRGNMCKQAREYCNSHFSMLILQTQLMRLIERIDQQ